MSCAGFVVSDAEAVQKTIAQVAEDFGRIDIFAANAGEFSLSGCHYKR